MARPRATAAARPAAASRPRRANPKRSFLSPDTQRSSPSTPASPATDVLSSLSSPVSSASPKPPPRSRPPRAKGNAKPAARSPLATPSPRPRPRRASSPVLPAAPPAAEAVSSVGDLRSAAAEQMEALKRRLDALHSRAHTDLDASLSRASKRFKTQNQACQQLTDEVDKEYKKMSESVKQNAEMIKAKYKQIVGEAQSSTSRVCKVTIPEITKSVEKAIDGLRSRYNISMPA